MAQGYRTAQPQFLEDIMYQPPWELMKQASAMKQQGYDDALAQTELMNSLLTINHIDDDVENEKVRNEKEYWEAQIGDIANEIKQGGNYRKSMPKIKGVQKGIMDSMTTGNISKFTQSATIRDKYLAAIEEAKKGKGGEVAASQQLLRSYMKEWEGQDNRSMDGSLKYEAAINTPDELKGANILDTAKKMPGNQNSYYTENKDGGYFRITNGQRETVTTEELLNQVSAYIMSNADVPLYFDQRDRIGMGTYFEGEGEDRKMIPSHSRVFVDPSTGERLPLDEAQKLPVAQQKMLRPDYDFADNSFGNAMRLGASVAYTKDVATTKLQIDQADQNELNRANQRNMQADRQAFAEKMEDKKHDNRVKLKSLQEGEKGELARKELEKINEVEGITL